MTTQTATGIPAAAGYPQYSGSIITPIYSDRLLADFYCSTVFGSITTTEYMGELNRCGDQITFRHEPRVRVHKLIKDGTLKADTWSTKSTTLTIDKGLYYNIKMSEIDELMMCNWSQWESALMRSTAREMADTVDCCILADSYATVDPANRGTGAGCQTKCYNLGEVGAPLVVNEDNILDVLLSIAAVLDEQCVPMDMRWLVIPPKWHYYLQKIRLCAVCSDPSGMDHQGITNGMIPEKIAGLNLFVSTKLSTVVDPVTNDVVYNLIAGWKGALTFASTIEKTRQVTAHDSFDDFWQGYMVFGYGTIYPEAMVHIYATTGQ